MKETAFSLSECSTDSSSEKDGNETKECDHEKKLFGEAVLGPGPCKSRKFEGHMDITTPKTATGIDRTKISDSKAAFKVTETT